MNPSNNPKLKESIGLEGYLGKQRPGAFHIYQKRYCKFLDEGLTFAYAEEKDDFKRSKISGQVPLKDVLDIVSEEKPKKFQLILEGRVYKFEASSLEEKRKWVNAIKLCKQYAEQFEERSKEQMLAVDDDIKFEDSMTHDEEDPSRKGSRFNPLGLLANTMKKVVVDTAIKTGVGIVKSGVDAFGNAINDSKPRSNEEYLKAKKLDTMLDSIEPKVLKSRLMLGYLLKETKEATGLGLVDGFVNDSGMRETITRRWCLLVSSKPIVFEEVDPNDEGVLDTGKLPFAIEPEVLYIYDDSCDESKPLESILLRDVIDTVVKKKNVNEQNYRFLLDLGERKINLLSPNITEMTRWVKAIQAARANLKEKSKSRLATVKNMYWHFKIINEEGEQRLKDKIEADYEHLTKGAEVVKADNVKELIRIQEKVANEFLAVINACLAHKDQRIDVIRLYVEAYHEAILNALRTFFRKNQSNLENKDIFELVKFLIWYRERLRIFGDAFADIRMAEGTQTLCKIVGRRILRSNMKTIKNIVLQEVEKEPEIDGRGRAATNTPNDVFKLANESFNVLSFCNTKELSLSLLEACSHTLEYFTNGLSYITENSDPSIDHLAAFCNNTLTYMSNIKDFGKQAEQLTGADKETIAIYFDEPAFNKTFIAQGKRSYEKLAYKIFSPLIDEWNNMSFLDIQLEKSLAEYIEKMNPVLEKLHGNFTNKIEAACLEDAVTFYIQAFLNSAEKKRFRSEDLDKIVGKFEDDTRAFGDVFSNIKKSTVESYMKPINNFHEFLTSNYAFLSMSVQSLKEQYGDSLKWGTVELLMRLRPDNLEKEERAELFKSCEQIFKTTQRKKEKTKNFNVFKNVNQNFEEEDAGRVKRSISMSSFIDDDSSSSDGGQLSRANSNNYINTKINPNMEGYLETDNNDFLGAVGGSLLSNLKFESRYFNLKRDVLYYYKERSSETSLGSYKLKEMVDSGTFETDHNMFFITLKSKDGENKIIRFKASKPDKRFQWLQAIREASILPEFGAMVELNASDVQFFKDNKPLFAEIEEQPDLEFTVAKAPPKNNKASIQSNATDISERENKRKRSFDINEDIPVSIPPPQEKGCMAKICSIFG